MRTSMQRSSRCKVSLRKWLSANDLPIRQHHQMLETDVGISTASEVGLQSLICKLT